MIVGRGSSCRTELKRYIDSRIIYNIIRYIYYIFYNIYKKQNPENVRVVVVLAGF
jgi:hypothetical protein